MNNFASQVELELRARCIQRMENILEMRSLISQCVNDFPAWVDALEMINPGAAAKCAVALSKSAPKGESDVPHNPESSLWMPHVRVLSSDALALISVTTPISWQPSESIMSQPEHQVVRLSVTCLEHLLTELGRQIVVGLQIGSSGASTTAARGLGQSVLGGSRTSKKGSKGASGSSDMTSSTAVSALSHFQRLRIPLTALGAQLSNCVSEFLSDAVAEEDRDKHQACILLCLKCLAGTLSASVFSNDPAARDLLFEILTGVQYRSRPKPPSASDPLGPKDIELAGKYAFAQLNGIGKVVVAREAETGESVDDSDDEVDATKRASSAGSATTFEITSAMLAALDAKFAHCSPLGSGKMSRQLSDAAGHLLERRWCDEALKTRKNLAILPGVIRIYIQKSSDPVDSIQTAYSQLEEFIKRKRLATEREAKRAVDATQASEEGDADGPDANGLVVWGTLSAKTTRPFFVGLVEQILWTLKCVQVDGEGEDDSSDAAFKRLVAIVNLTSSVLELVRQDESFMGPAMRAGRNWVELFMRVCMPFLKGQMKDHRQRVLKVFKKQQKVIRLLQHVCSHGKAMRSNGLSGLVPPLRKTLEVWLYKTREFLSSGADEAAVSFRVGTLATRDLQGNRLKDNTLVQPDAELSSDDAISEIDEVDRDDDEEEEEEEEQKGLENSNPGNGMLSLSLPPARITTADRAKAKKKRARAEAKKKAAPQRKGRKRKEITDDDMRLGESSRSKKKQRKSKKAQREDSDPDSEIEDESLLVVDEDDDESDGHSEHSLRQRSKKGKAKKRTKQRSGLLDTQASESDHTGSDEDDSDNDLTGSMNDFVVD